MCVLPFTSDLMRLSPESFTHTVLASRCTPRTSSWGRTSPTATAPAGTVETLTAEGRRFGFSVEGVGLASLAEEATADDLLDLRPGLRRRR